MLTVSRGEHVPLRLSIFDEDDIAFDPTTDPQLTITDKSGTEFLAITTMTRESTGQWYYYPATSATTPMGEYQVKYTITDQAIVFIFWDEFTVGR